MKLYRETKGFCGLILEKCHVPQSNRFGTRQRRFFKGPIMRIAYARCSTAEQTLDLQLRCLERVGYDRLFTDEGASGARSDRPGYSAALEALEPGRTLVVWRMDRMSRSFRDLIDTLYAFHNQGIGFVSLCESFDLNTAVGELTMQMLSAIAHFERALLIERTKAGMEAALAKGHVPGRPPAIDGEDLEEALYLIEKGLGVQDTAKHLGVGRSTLYRYLADLRAMPGMKGAAQPALISA